MPKPFEKNDPRINRRGRPKKGQTMTDILNWALDQKRKIRDGETGKEKSLLMRHIVAARLISKAIDDGDVAALKYIFDRLDGKPMQQIGISTPRSDIPDDPEERRRLMEQIEWELGLTGSAAVTDRNKQDFSGAVEDKTRSMIGVNPSPGDS